jgi:peroxiredoxin
METILVQPDNEEQAKMIQAFLEQHKLKSRLLSDEDKEDVLLGQLIEATDYDNLIDTDMFIKKLRG